MRQTITISVDNINLIVRSLHIVQNIAVASPAHARRTTHRNASWGIIFRYANSAAYCHIKTRACPVNRAKIRKRYAPHTLYQLAY